MRVSIIGTGYVGLTTGVCLAFVGHQVSCLDTDSGKIGMLCAGKVPIYERGLEELLEMARSNLRFTTSAAEAIGGAEVVFIAVGTPPQSDGSPDLAYIRAAAQSVVRHLGDDLFTVVVNKSNRPLRQSPS